MVRRRWAQAAIIFLIPCVQLVFTYFDLAQRYIVGTLIGCSAVYDVSWPKNVVYDAPPAVFAVLSVPYAVLLWRRYRAIARQAQGILNSNSEASIRANRTRRRLYNMSLSILVVYVPVMVFYLVFTIQDTLSSYRPYDYDRIRWSATPYPWDTILFVPSWIIPSPVLNQPWIPIATSVVIVAFFGTTVEAKKMYRGYLESAGLNKQDSIIPTIERPDSVRVTVHPSSPLPSPAHTTLKTPPTIPPRYSSLRRTFTFRSPTLQSIRKTIRIPSLRSNTAEASSGSSKLSSRRTGLTNRDNSIPMLPLHRTPRRREADSRSSFGSFLARDIRDASSPVEISVGREFEDTRRRSEFQVRVPIVRPRQMTDEGCEAGRGTGRVGLQPELTMSTLYTTSDTRNESHYSAVQDAGDDIGIAK
ncbi:hypothetical protein ONZ43_g7292 [Nemania bipapillata]|uniref:Uncharacterized protein n=1 Tax=Nemania bipapillata TaxID=110536 RepID=A0ACC2HSR6_9PEZI|nr:hypothetical protein ONZ43_g7292 [Nemania bipapillata]